MPIQVRNSRQACRAIQSGAQGCSGTDPSFMHVVKLPPKQAAVTLERQQLTDLIYGQ